jgi:hypothetical protein
MVSPQRSFRTAYGRVHRVDFVIVDGNVRIAVEVDGFDKYGRGSGMTRDEHDAWVAREGDLHALGWTLFRTSNSDFMGHSERVAEMLGEVLRLQRQLWSAQPSLSARPAAAASSMGGVASARPSLSAQPAASGPSMGRVAIFVIGALLVLTLLVRGASSSGGPGATSSARASVARSASPVPGTPPRACPSDYPIKGNLSGTSRIYHVMGGNFYAATNPESCFATERDAQAAAFASRGTDAGFLC